MCAKVKFNEKVVNISPYIWNIESVLDTLFNTKSVYVNDETMNRIWLRTHNPSPNYEIEKRGKRYIIFLQRGYIEFVPNDNPEWPYKVESGYWRE